MKSALLIAALSLTLTAAEPPAKQQTAPAKQVAAAAAPPTQPADNATKDDWISFFQAKATYNEKLAEHYRSMYDNLFMQMTAPKETQANEQANAWLDKWRADHQAKK